MDLPYRRSIAVLAGVVAFAFAWGMGIPASATAAPELPDLRVSVSYGKPTYDALDTIGIHVAVVNVGEGVANKVTAWGSANVAWQQGWEPLGSPGARLCSGTVYQDANYNSVRDGSESGLRGVQVDLFTAEPPQVSVTTTTDFSGKFAFVGIPAGRYSARFSPPQGWSIGAIGDVVVGPGAEPDVLVRAVTPLAGVLKPAIAFRKTTYAPGETAHLTVTLTNTGHADLSGITASSVPSQNGLDAQPDWGEFASPGVAVPAGQTRTFDVPVLVPQVAFDYGHVTVRAEFKVPGAQDSPVVQTVARVPGGIGTHISGLVELRRSTGHSEITNTKVYLTDQVTGRIVARAITDMHGVFRFPDLPADLYDFHIVGRWRPSTMPLQVFAGSNADIPNVMRVFDYGPEQPDPDLVTTTPVPTTTPAPTTTQVPVPSSEQNTGDTAQLAQTGADVGDWVIWALLALPIGVCLVLVARRRPPRT